MAPKKRYDNKFFSPLSLIAVFGSGMGKNQDPESGINILDPQHGLKYIANSPDPDTVLLYSKLSIKTVGRNRMITLEKYAFLLLFILRIRIFPSQIQGQKGSRFRIRMCVKEFNYIFYPKNCF
jgi:hypothetical protein